MIFQIIWQRNFFLKNFTKIIGSIANQEEFAKLSRNIIKDLGYGDQLGDDPNKEDNAENDNQKDESNSTDNSDENDNTEQQLPDEVEVETPSQTEVVLKSHNKQILGQAAAEIRSFRPPEPYKGKGVRYADEHVKRKEAKKAAGAGA